MFPLTAHMYFEMAALVASVIFWHRIKHTHLRWFLPFLLFIVLIELSGRYIRKELHLPNAWLYNISVPIEYCFYTFILWAYFKSAKVRRITAAFLLCFFLFCLANMFFVQGFRKFNTNILKVASFAMIVLSCLYFTELMRLEHQVDLLREPMFWIVTGLFLFNAGEFFYSLFSDYLITHRMDRTRYIFASINNKLIWVLYTCFIISFLCSESRRQKA